MTISIPKTQRAAVVAELGQPVEIQSDWPVVQPEDLSPGQVLVKMEVSGICHSDLHIKNGEWPSKPAPFIGGHEGVGTIVAFGKGTTETDKVKMGSRVGIKWVLGSCGRCEYCRTGRDAGCEDIIRSGQTADGTFSEYMVAYANHVVPIPKEISSDEAVPIMCAGLTVYAALKKGHLGVGEWVVIPGAGGGLGHLAVQYAVAMGLRVIAIDTGAEKKEACHSLGAEKWIDFAQTEDLVREVIAAAGAPGPHAALIVTPSINAYDQAVLYLRKYGTIIGVGIPTPPLTFKVPMIAILGKAIKIQPSVLGNLQEAIEALELVARKKVHAQTLPRKLDDITSTYEDMVAGKLVGRAVIHF